MSQRVNLYIAGADGSKKDGGEGVVRNWFSGELTKGWGTGWG